MILVLNCGSLSVKYKLFEGSFNLVKEKNEKVENRKFFQKILKDALAQIKNQKIEISKIGHRVVHGGDKFKKPLLITKTNLKELEKYNKLAPLHNPFNVLGIKIAQKVFPKVSQVAVFDTGFYMDLPDTAGNYALPENISKNYGFKKYGFHGISHEYVARKAAADLNKNFNELKIISCHLGGGASVCAIKDGKAGDTSMGYTPLEGLMMMTRSGDVDPGVVLTLAKTFSADKAQDILNNESGVYGICGEKSMLKVLERTDKDAELALGMFVYRIKKYIGAYFAALNGCDILIFTGAIGEGSQKIRDMVCTNLGILKDTRIMAIKTVEELMIAKTIQKF
jgi:acetate kinase